MSHIELSLHLKQVPEGIRNFEFCQNPPLLHAAMNLTTFATQCAFKHVAHRVKSRFDIFKLSYLCDCGNIVPTEQTTPEILAKT